MDKQSFLRIMPSAKEEADTYLPIFERLMPLYNINTRRRQAHFLSQIAVESGELQWTQENLNYSAVRLLKVFPRYFKTIQEANRFDHKPAKIANKVYANRIGNGDEASGDGWRFRGRGLIQLTGRANYMEYFNHLVSVDNSATDRLDYEAKILIEDFEKFGQTLDERITEYLTELVARPEHAVRSACWFWNRHGINTLADSTSDESTVLAITRRINGGTNGLIERKKYYYRAKAML